MRKNCYCKLVIVADCSCVENVIIRARMSDINKSGSRFANLGPVLSSRTQVRFRPRCEVRGSRLSAQSSRYIELGLNLVPA